MTDLKHLIIDLELALQDPARRQDIDLVESILHTDFVEFGSNGFESTRSDVLKWLARDNVPAIHSDNFQLNLLSDSVAQLTYRARMYSQTRKRESESMRSSIWVFANGRWQMKFHQGTPID